MINKHIARRIIQVIFLLAAIGITIYITRIVAHQYCPYAVVCFGVRSINPQSSLDFAEAALIGLLILFSTLFIGRRYCGYICPLGTVSEYLNYLNPGKNKVNISPIYEKRLRIGKYLLLCFNLIIIGVFLGRQYFSSCPVMILAGLSEPEFLTPGIYLLVLIFIGNILIIRAWCRYLCPYAALMNCFQFIGKLLHVRKTKIYRNLETCIDCYNCQKSCQMNINILNEEDITDFNCIYCLDCIKVCPKKNTLTHTWG